MRKRPAPTFILSLMTAYLGLLAASAGLLLLYLRVWHIPGDPAGLARLFAFAAAAALAALAAFRILAVRFRRRLRAMIDGMYGMLEGEDDPRLGRVEATAEDELGQLGRAFNELQAYASRRYEDAARELRLSDSLQRGLLPGGEREAAGCRIAAVCRQTRDVGGDLYDISPLGDGRAAILVADVAGKGMQAALLMSATMALFRREIKLGGTAADTLTRLNRSLAGALQGQTYVTAGLAMIDARAGVIDYASAGHMPPYLLNEDRLEEVEVSSLPLGVSAAVVYRERRVSFPAGARFVMYTDGMVECAGADGEMLGFDRFEKLLMTMDVRLEPGEQMKALMERVDAAAVSSEEADDRTIVLIERSRRAAGDL